MGISDKRITGERISEYMQALREQERSVRTVRKYEHDLEQARKFLSDGILTKEALIEWKNAAARRYAAASVNAMTAAVNGFLSYYGWGELRLRPLKIQRNLFTKEERELTKAEYFRLIRAAEQKGSRRLSLIIQTICATGIRVSELQFVTAEAVAVGYADVFNKGKRRTVFLPEKLRMLLKKYLKKQKKASGAIFITKNGKPLDRSNIWRDMKALCETAGVASGKVFPHNLRHLFARTYYAIEKDLSRLADILGHSNVNTTRIYTIETGSIHAKQLNHMGLVASVTT